MPFTVRWLAVHYRTIVRYIQLLLKCASSFNFYTSYEVSFEQSNNQLTAASTFRARMLVRRSKELRTAVLMISPSSQVRSCDSQATSTTISAN